MPNGAEAPLCVDLDGTIIATDSLRVGLRRLAIERPLSLFGLPFAVLRGRAAFKRYVSNRVALDAASLPYRRAVLEFVREQRAAGRRVILATAADSRYADAVARDLGLFDTVLSSDGHHNLRGQAKADAIRELLHGAPFDFIADTSMDLPALRAARNAYLVHPSAKLLAEAQRSCHVVRVFD
jgi:phosphoserine phosphatase